VLSTGLTACTTYYNHHHSHQALNNQPPVKVLKREVSIHSSLIKSKTYISRRYSTAECWLIFGKYKNNNNMGKTQSSITL
jgi:hypothetical protein